jgi:hypothetical protein
VILVTQAGLAVTHTGHRYLEVMDALKPGYKALNYIGFTLAALDSTRVFGICGASVAAYGSIALGGER